MAGLIALLALIGYAYSAISLIGVRQYIPMALNTAIAFAVLSVGILYARPGRGLMAVVTSRGAGGVMARRLLPAAIVIPAAVGWVGWLLVQQGGVADPVMGLSLFVVANIVIFTALIWWNAASLEPHGPRAPAGGAAPGRPVHGLARPGGVAAARRRRAQDPAGDLREPGLDGGRHVAGRPGGRRAALRRRVARARRPRWRNSWP